jgi:hypothetical protein
MNTVGADSDLITEKMCKSYFEIDCLSTLIEILFVYLPVAIDSIVLRFLKICIKLKKENKKNGNKKCSNVIK